MSALVCGFRHAEGGLAGLAWDLGGAMGGVVTLDGATARPGDAEVSSDGNTTSLTVRGDDGVVEAELRPRTAPVPLADQGAEAAPCQATVRVDGGRKLKCDGYLTRWREDPVAGAGVVRHVAIPAADESVLVAISRAEPDADSHAAEAASAWLVSPDGSVAAYPEALISTQYDAAGRQTRVGLELWPAEQDAPPMRAAGTALGAAAQEAKVTGVLLESWAEGHAGAGGYVIAR